MTLCFVYGADSVIVTGLDQFSASAKIFGKQIFSTHMINMKAT
jgi:hypothetical protein